MKHKQSLCNLLFCFTFFLLVNNIRAQVKPFPKDAWGVYSWMHIGDLTKENAPLIKGGPILMRWASIEPTPDKFDFESQIKPFLQRAVDNNFYCFLKIYVASPNTNSKVTPEWLYNPPYNVQKVVADGTFPFYLNQTYKDRYYLMIQKFGEYVQSLPENLKSRILFIQATEGTTGDGGFYKGYKEGSGFDIKKDDWEEFRKAAWEKYKTAFSNTDGVLQFKILTNNDSNTPKLKEWMLANLPGAIGVKNGMFTHGYQISDAQQRLSTHIDLKIATEAINKEFYARGEMDAELHENLWLTKNQTQGAYWSAIYATHCAISMWNFPYNDVKAPTKFEGGIKFFNKYAGQLNAKNANNAFCAFYRGLDAADTTLFPVNPFGEAKRDNTNRYKAIVAKFASNGAVLEDPVAVVSSPMGNRQATGYNDAGWKILTTNFERHLTQIEPETTSLAWWNVDGIRPDAPIYGRFARGFKPGVKEMCFNLDDKFYSLYPDDGHCIRVTITYRALDKGTWNFKCKTKSGEFTRNVKNTVTGNQIWKTLTFVVNNAILKNEGPKGADFWLENVEGTECRFHMIEIEKVKCTTTTSRIGLKEGQADKIDGDFDTEANFTINQDYLNNTIKVSSQNKLANISLFDISGKQIQNHSCNNEEFVVDTNKMSSGVYIIVVTDQYGNQKNDKFIIK